LYRLRAGWQIPFQCRFTHYNLCMHCISHLLCVLCVLCGKSNAAEPPIATFSIVGYDPATGDLGVGVQSKFFSVGSVVPWAKAGVGAVATQSWANVTYGPEGLKLLEKGKSPAEAMKILTQADARREFRQVGIVDAKGRAESFTGKRCNEWAGHQTGKHYAAQGNILAGEAVVKDMAAVYEKAQKKPGTELADWLMAALEAAQAAGGDKRGRQSSALLVVRAGGGYSGQGDRYIDLRVEDHKTPVEELGRLLKLHKNFFRSRHLKTPKRETKDEK
jgi:uncharacterized Ntn-hydrolase superfamily protein